MNDIIDTPPQQHRIAVRFGDAILQAGHTAVPNLALNYYSSLGISHAEMMFAIHIWQYWWTEREPYPALGTIALKMGISRRQARNYAQGLRRKGLLEVHERHLPGRGQVTSEYNFTPFIEAIVRLANAPSDDPGKDPSGGGRKDPSAAPGNPISDKEDAVQEDSPSISSMVYAQSVSERRAERRSVPASAGRAASSFQKIDQLLQRQPPSSPPAASATRGEAEAAISACLKELRLELGDRATLGASVARALNLYRRAGLDLASFTGQLYQARSLTRDRLAVQPGTSTTPPSRPPQRPMAYYFAVLEELLNLRPPGSGRRTT